jgi:predicted Zn-dependent protease
MIESARLDTTIFKFLGYSIFLHQSGQLNAAKDSLKNLVKTRLGDYALYYLALTFIKQENLGQALSALDNLTISFPDHKIHNAILLQAGIYIDLNKEKEARAILEELIVREPTSIYAVKARGMLENNFE